MQTHGCENQTERIGDDKEKQNLPIIENKPCQSYFKDAYRRIKITCEPQVLSAYIKAGYRF